MAEAHVNVVMIAGPVFLTDNNGSSYAVRAAQDGYLKLYVVPNRYNSHFRANLYTGELYYEYPHAPNEKHRMSVHFPENRYEVKKYLHLAKKLIKKAKPFKQCTAGQDYLLFSDTDLEKVKRCIDINGMNDFNDYTVKEIRQIGEEHCSHMV
jgi:hypothetical protein